MTAQEQIDALRADLEAFRDQHEVDMTTVEASLTRIEKRRRTSLKGLRTKISGWLSTLPMIALAGGYQIDPAMVGEVLKEGGWLLAALQVAGGYAVHHYRNKAGEPVKP